MLKKVLIGVIVLLIGSVGVGAFYVYSKLNKIDQEELDADKLVVNEDLAEDLGDGYTTFAIFGLDSREGELEKGVRSDSILVANLNNKTKEVQLISVYRDTLLDMTDGDLHKANSAYSYGGAEQAVNVLNMNLDLNIADYVAVDFTAVAEVVDLLGGIEINVQEEEVEYLNQFLGETAAVAKKEMIAVDKPGLQVLDGAQATTYARIRSTAGGDFKRAERQRVVIEKMVEKAKTSDFSTLNQIIDKVLPSIKTSFSPTEIIKYARHYADYKLTNSEGFPMEKNADRIDGVGSVVIPVTLETNVQELHKLLYGTLSYTVSAQVSSISRAIEEMVGEQEAQNNDDIYNQYYEDTDEDRQQENWRSGSGGSSSGGSNGSRGQSSGGNNNQNSNSNNNDNNTGQPVNPDDNGSTTEPPDESGGETPTEPPNERLPDGNGSGTISGGESGSQAQ